jgi:ferrochelatase
MGRADGVLMVAHGSISTLDELPEFLLKIRRGRPPSPQLIEELRHRYDAIGGSPLLDLTLGQARALEAQLGIPVLVGMRLWHPFVEDVLLGVPSKVSRLCVLPMAPFSVHIYFDAAERALAQVADRLERPLQLVAVQPWGTHPDLIEAQAVRIEQALEGYEQAHSTVLLTAHSLPTAVIRAGDPYAIQVEACARAIGERLQRPYQLAYQSQGADGGDWLGPDVRTTLEQIRAAGGQRVVLAPIGFLAEHVETLYDLDVEVASWARELGLELTRVGALNDDSRLIQALSDVVRTALAQS